MFRQGGHSTAVVTGGRRRVSTTFDDGAELIEEYDAQTGELLLRKHRKKSTLGGLGEWEYLVGEAPQRWNPEGTSVKESSDNPIFTRKDLREAFQWRIRNLPYPPETYSVTVDPSDNKIVVRTSNKKYFKRFDIPEMNVLKLKLTDNALSWSHSNNTLIISYAKPAVVIEAERKEAEDNRKLRAQQEGDVECKQQ